MKKKKLNSRGLCSELSFPKGGIKFEGDAVFESSGQFLILKSIHRHYEGSTALTCISSRFPKMHLIGERFKNIYYQKRLCSVRMTYVTRRGCKQDASFLLEVLVCTTCDISALIYTDTASFFYSSAAVFSNLRNIPHQLS